MTSMNEPFFFFFFINFFSTDSLLSMFSRMGTTDHDELIKQFQTIVPGTPNESMLKFQEFHFSSLEMQNSIIFSQSYLLVADFFLSASDWTLAVSNFSTS